MTHIETTPIHVILVLCIIGIFTTSAQSEKGTIEVTVTNIKSDKGTLIIGLYKSADTFLKKPSEYKKPAAKKGKLSVIFTDVEPGTYAISLYHDEDDNGKLNTNMLGIPTEYYGTSNNAKGMFGPPKWEDAKFIISADQMVKQKIDL